MVPGWVSLPCAERGAPRACDVTPVRLRAPLQLSQLLEQEPGFTSTMVDATTTIDGEVVLLRRPGHERAVLCRVSEQAPPACRTRRGCRCGESPRFEVADQVVTISAQMEAATAAAAAAVAHTPDGATLHRLVLPRGVLVPRVASSVVLRVVSSGGSRAVRLPQAASVREQIAHSVRTGAPVIAGCRIRRPAGIVHDCIVVRTIPRNVLVICARESTVSFDQSSPAAAESSASVVEEGEEGMKREEEEEEEEEEEKAARRELREALLWPVQHKDVFAKYGNVQAPSGILLHGPPGTGKTSAVRDVVTALQRLVPCKVLHVGFQGGLAAATWSKEERLRDMFEEAHRFVHDADTAKATAASTAMAATSATTKNSNSTSTSTSTSISTSTSTSTSESESCRGPRDSRADARCVIFLDELDGLCPARRSGPGGSSAADNRVVAQLLTLMDGLRERDPRVVVVAATNRPDAVDGALRRPGRFEREIEFRPPSRDERLALLRRLLGEAVGAAHVAAAAADWLPDVATECVGFVEADVAALAQEALRRAGDEQIAGGEQTADAPTRAPTRAHFQEAAHVVGAASLLRQRGLALPPSSSSSPSPLAGRVGGYERVKEEMARAVEWPVKHRAAMQRLGLSAPRGVLLHGPPGCSKTTLARAAASQAGVAFFALSSAQVYSPFVGDSEKAVRDVFANARLAAPAIVFLDEVEAMVGKRGLTGGGNGGNGGGGVQARVLSTLLNEMDGVQSADGLLVLAATNRIDMVDEALLRPGRFDRLVHVPLPCLQDRVEIMRVHTTGMPCEGDVDDLLAAVAARTEGFSGAALENVCREAAMSALRSGKQSLTTDDFLAAVH